MNFCVTNLAPDDSDYPEECLEEIVFGCPKPLPRPPVIADTIAIIGVSPCGRPVRVVLTATRIVYAGKWREVPDWLDVPPSFVDEFKALATAYGNAQRQMHTGNVEFLNCGKVGG